MNDNELPAESLNFELFCADPKIRDSAPAKTAILRGPVYSDDSTWGVLLKYRSEVERWLAEVGARLHIDMSDGFAYADHAEETEPGGDWPRLFYRDRFTFEVTCVLLVLRDWLLSQETKTRNDQVPLSYDDLLVMMRPFYRKEVANVEKEEKRWREAINKVIGYGFLKKGKTEANLIVRPIIRAKLSIDVLKNLRESLTKYAQSENTEEGGV